MFAGFWWGNLRERNNFKDPDVDGMIILRWLRTGTDGRNEP
jgi:hypothetical protein